MRRGVCPHMALFGGKYVKKKTSVQAEGAMRYEDGDAMVVDVKGRWKTSTKVEG